MDLETKKAYMDKNFQPYHLSSYLRIFFFFHNMISDDPRKVRLLADRFF